jgi:hypothetical protein
MNELTEAATLHCANCATPLQGEFCHHCGQSVHSVLKPVHHMLEDSADMFLHVDGRILNTLPPLATRPGFLTLEYFAGRRQRYVAPFRLMFVLCLVAFFAVHLALGDGPDTTGSVRVDTAAIDRAATPADVQRALQDNLRGLQEARQAPGMAALAARQLDQAEAKYRRAAAARRIALGDPTATLPPTPARGAEATATPAPATPQASSNPLSEHWDAQRYPVHVRWLPGFLNHRLNLAAQRMHANLAAMSGDGEAPQRARERIVGELFSALPQTMLLLLPLFALLLKLVYLWRRRLYMEHLIVALHSHAFLFLALLAVVLLTLLGDALAPHAAWAASALGMLRTALLVWIPLYLLLMQKRVYRQGWPMTLFKYLLVGYCYTFLLGLVLAGGFLWTLAH